MEHYLFPEDELRDKLYGKEPRRVGDGVIIGVYSPPTKRSVAAVRNSVTFRKALAEGALSDEIKDLAEIEVSDSSLK